MQRSLFTTLSLSAFVAAMACVQARAQTGARVDIYTEIGGGVVPGDLRNAVKYPAAPDRVEVAKFFEYPAGLDDGTPPPGDVENNYGWVISANLIPKETGQYIFYIAADDGAELWLSTDADPANKTLIASEPIWNPVRAWIQATRRSGCPADCQNISEPISLQANTKYYIEALAKEGGGGDNLAVTWKKVGDPDPVQPDPAGNVNGTLPISAEFLEAVYPTGGSIYRHPQSPSQPAEEGTTVTLSAAAGLSFDANKNVVVPTYQWLKNGTVIAGATESVYTTPPLALADNNAKFSVRIGSATSTEATVAVVPKSQTRLPGYVKVEYFFDVPGVAVADLQASPKYIANDPDLVEYSPIFEQRNNNAGVGFPGVPNLENYGTRITGYIVPKETASYIFFMSTDDGGELWLSTDDTPAKQATIAVEPTWNGVRDWVGAARRPGCPDGCENRSSPITLQAGQRYSIRMEQKEGGGGDNGAVTWIKQGDPLPAPGSLPITGEFLEADINTNLVPQVTITGQPVAASVTEPATATFSVVASPFPLAYQWQRNGTNIPGATSASYTTPKTKDELDNGAKYRVAVSNPVSAVTSTEVVLTVAVDNVAPKIASATSALQNVTVTFDEDVDASTTGNKANFAIDKGITINTATARGDKSVELAVSGLVAGTEYTVTVNNVKDTQGNTLAANSTAKFLAVAFKAFYNFNDGQVPPGTQIFNNAAGTAAVVANGGLFTSGVLRLTEQIGSQQSSFVIPDLDNGAPVFGFTAKFKMQVGPGSGNAADGWAFLWATDVPDGDWGEEGSGTGVTFTFDTYDNGASEAPAVDIKWQGTEVVTYKTNKAALVTSRIVDVALQVAPDGSVTVVHDNVVYHNKVKIDGFAPLSGARFGIGGRTGGENEVKLVDDLGITTYLSANDTVEDIIPDEGTPPPTISAVKTATGITITFTGKLQSADVVSGPYADVANATSPANIPTSGAAKFYRAASN